MTRNEAKALLGLIPDADIARMTGVSRERVRQWRASAGVPVAPSFLRNRSLGGRPRCAECATSGHAQWCKRGREIAQRKNHRQTATRKARADASGCCLRCTKPAELNRRQCQYHLDAEARYARARCAKSAP